MPLDNLGNRKTYGSNQFDAGHARAPDLKDLDPRIHARLKHVIFSNRIIVLAGNKTRRKGDRVFV